jgi:hypothetical protein
MLYLPFKIEIMEKEFNTTGTCSPAKHYMADVSKKLKQTFSLVEKGKYFIINRPRQYGKTTTMFTTTDKLRKMGNYVVFTVSFEGVGDLMFTDEKIFAPRFVSLLATYCRRFGMPELANWLSEAASRTHNMESLSDTITGLVSQTDKKVVLMIDEVDKSSNNQLFVSFLAMLRDKYLLRDDIKTFHSIVLAGLHDVKTLKLKLRPDDEKKFNSPWNIAAEFKVDMNLYPNEIKPMLDDYVQETGVTMDTKFVAERLFYYTSGYPFLVSKLCKTIAEDIVPEKEEQTWTFEDIETSVRLLMKERNTNFDSLINSLENDKNLYDFVYRIIMEGDMIFFNPDEPLIQQGLMHGIFKDEGHIKIHNRVYEERLYNYMTAKTTVAMKSDFNYAHHFTLENEALDMPAVLLKFQQFMKEEFNEKDKTFLERQGRLVFLSFLTPILNGKGQSFKEVQTSEEKRLDIVATYGPNKYIIELKRWYGDAAHQRGLAQLSDYLDIQGEQAGYLVIFEYNKVKSWDKQWIDYKGKRIFAVWV